LCRGWVLPSLLFQEMTFFSYLILYLILSSLIQVHLGIAKVPLVSSPGLTLRGVTNGKKSRVGVYLGGELVVRESTSSLSGVGYFTRDQEKRRDREVSNKKKDFQFSIPGTATSLEISKRDPASKGDRRGALAGKCPAFITV